MPELMLPEEEFIPVNDGVPKDLTMLLFGPPKVGKTTFAASFPKSIVLECEPGGFRYVRGHKVDVGSYEELRGYYNLLAKDTRFETVVIDSLDKVAEWIEEGICTELGISNIMENRKGERIGSQWGMYADRVLTFLAGWQAMRKRLIFLAHTKKAEIADGGMVINPKTINLYGSAASGVMAVVENIGHMYATEVNGEVKRYLSFKPGIYVEAGSRNPCLTDKVIDLPKENPYGAFEALFKTPTKARK